MIEYSITAPKVNCSNLIAYCVYLVWIILYKNNLRTMGSTENENAKDKEAIMLKTNHKHQMMLNLELDRIEKCRKTYESAHQFEVTVMKARCDRLAQKQAELSSNSRHTKQDPTRLINRNHAWAANVTNNARLTSTSDREIQDSTRTIPQSRNEAPVTQVGMQSPGNFPLKLQNRSPTAEYPQCKKNSAKHEGSRTATNGVITPSRFMKTERKIPTQMKESRRKTNHKHEVTTSGSNTHGVRHDNTNTESDSTHNRTVSRKLTERKSPTQMKDSWLPDQHQTTGVESNSTATHGIRHDDVTYIESDSAHNRTTNIKLPDLITSPSLEAATTSPHSAPAVQFQLHSSDAPLTSSAAKSKPPAYSFSPQLYRMKNSKKRKSVAHSRGEDMSTFDRYRMKLQESEERTRKTKPQLLRSISAMDTAMARNSARKDGMKERRAVSVDLHEVL